MKSPLLALFVALFSFSISAHALEQCPVEFGQDYLEKVATLATEAESCYEASAIVNACALGASGDVYTVAFAIARCEKDIPQMSKKDLETFSYLKTKCNEKYDSMDGTLYRSMNAFCHLSVTELFVDLLSKEE
ncbi:MAG: hypothetical protein WC635_05370 [Bacteriovorax sp.]